MIGKVGCKGPGKTPLAGRSLPLCLAMQPINIEHPTFHEQVFYAFVVACKALILSYKVSS